MTPGHEQYRKTITDKTKIYPGIDQDSYGGMTDIGRIIRDAWVFSVIPESETCAGWDCTRIESLYDWAHTEWLKSMVTRPAACRRR